ncbi:helix-turn-helix domain-containing protein [bacterium]|nr:helix-turn-helix domain-containing protein [bacterium]
MSRARMIAHGPTKRWLNSAEAASYLGLSIKALYERCRLRKLPYSRLGGSLRFDKLELDRILERSRVKPVGMHKQ